MKTVISGKITRAILDDADLMAGITPSSFVHNGYSHHRVPADIPTAVEPPDSMLPGETGDKQRNWTMCLHADAVIVADGDAHLVRCAQSLKLPVYEA